MDICHLPVEQTSLTVVECLEGSSFVPVKELMFEVCQFLGLKPGDFILGGGADVSDELIVILLETMIAHGFPDSTPLIQKRPGRKVHENFSIVHCTRGRKHECMIDPLIVPIK